MMKFLALLLLLCPLFAYEACVKTENESFIIDLPPELSLMEMKEEVREILGKNEVKKVLFEIDLEDNKEIAWQPKAKKHGGELPHPRNYYAQIPDSKVHDIRHLVSFLAKHSMMTLAMHARELEEIGDRVDDVHPLVFLYIIFSNQKSLVDLRNVRGKGIVWSEFSSGLKGSLNIEHDKHRNIKEEHVKDFAKKLNIDANLILPSIRRKDWDEFIDILIAKVPRTGNYDRYDS